VKTILLIRWGGLGDLLVTLPAIRLLRHGLPSANLTLVARREYGDLLLQSGVVDAVVGLDDPRTLALFSGAGSGAPDRSGWLGGFDLVVSWLNRATGDSPDSGLAIRYGSGGRESISRVFYYRTVEAVGKDLLRRMDFDECSRLPLSSIPDVPGFSFQDRPGGSRPLAVIHPGSGGEKKKWPLESFLEIAGRLRDKNAEGVFVTGEAEHALDRRVEAAARRLGWTWLRSPSLGALARRLGDVDLYLGNDSGITHLAAACGTRVLALFRNDLVETWRPYGDSHVLSGDVIEAIGLESVWSAVAQLLCR
jgi:ADP-heptose:LPS heptosyltransferase